MSLLNGFYYERSKTVRMLSNSDLTEKVVEKAKSLGASIAGVARVESLKNSPSHRILPKIGLDLNEKLTGTEEGMNLPDVCWPTDAVSAVVIGVEHHDDQPELDWWDGKGTPGNRMLIEINDRLSEWLEKTFTIKSYKLPYFIEKGGIFLKDAAVYAGLGCIGKNNLVITPEYGPRVRFRALLLNRDAQTTTAPEFNPCETCDQPCLKACPVNAFQSVIYSPESMGQSLLPGINGTYDRVTCNIKMEKDIDDAAKMMAPNQKERQRIRQSIGEFEESHIEDPAGNQPFVYHVRYCRECELSCPVGIR